MHRRGLIAAFGAIALASPRAARAGDYPDRPVRIILPYTAGSPNDVIARFIAPYLLSRLRQPLAIENRAGGGTLIGARAVMTAEPDGYTLLFSNSPTHVVASLGHPSLAYDPLKDFAPIAMVGSSALVMVIAPGVPARSVQEFVAYARANPGRQLRIWTGHLAASGRRAVQDGDCDRHRQRTLSRRHAGGLRHAGRAHRDEFRQRLHFVSADP